MSLFRPNDSGICITVSARTDVGRSRKHNEDSLLVADLTTQDTSIDDDLKSPEDVGPREPS